MWVYLSAEILAGMAAGFVYTALKVRRAVPTALTVPTASSVAVPSEGVPA
jgi:xanthosine utilization system XapX-like protein